MDISQRLRDLTRPTGEEDLLAVKYPEPRFRISTTHGLWVAVGCVVALCLWLMLRDAPSPPQPIAPAQRASVTTAPDHLVVSVVGEVSSPGLVTLTPGARVDAAVKAAGALPSADLAGLNLAEKLVDGKQIVVPAPGMAGPGGAAQPGKIALNAATAAELEQLDGVGAKTAEAIIKHRDTIGGFTALEQLKDVKGIGPAKFAAIEPEVTL